MFRLADLGRVWVPVVLPAEEGEQTIHLLLQLYTKDELRAREKSALQRTAGGFADAAAAAKTVEDLERLFDEVTAIGDDDRQELLSRTHDWRGVGAADGEPEAFAPAKMEALLQFNWVFTRCRAALFEMSRDGTRKNSLPGPDGSPTPAQA